MNGTKNLIYLAFFSPLLLFSCSKDPIPPALTKARFNIKVQVGSAPLEWHAIKYFNAATNQYGTDNLYFYISNVSFKQANGKVYSSPKIFYIDASVASLSNFHLDSIPPGTYSEMTFLLGIDPSKNKSFSLPATTDNINMAWPDFMGGGYHFLKFEGNFINPVDQQKGFAIHLGRNGNSPQVKITTSMNQEFLDHTYSLIFDLNEVFKNPYTYDFNKDPNYTMMDSLAMNIIKNNMSNAFNLIQNK